MAGVIKVAGGRKTFCNKPKIMWKIIIGLKRETTFLACLIIIYDINLTNPESLKLAQSTASCRDHTVVSLVAISVASGPSLCKSFGSVPKALSPNNKSISSKLTCVVSLNKKKMVGNVTKMLNAAQPKSALYAKPQPRERKGVG